jgi:hypothetical protein
MCALAYIGIVELIQYAISIFFSQMLYLNSLLKELTNENRGGLNLVSFDWSPFKIFSLGFSKESVQTQSCQRPKTVQRTLFSI